ncbi:vitamin B6 photo-protection and homoeostasis-domain-containing protein [Ampelomyces quisqualis]|uniref:Vitamin B6 photo-protection and homoeostasis-domain-containing protein n=1 Tax=Ampelomyces quisqualis TaxID=50730 RepID=A0A6A5R1K7_AMPQU|nr:vitamin B6 photo-protection and homoeostasis-domain-containing protein [Ampelomyces quisqualis]
MCACEIVERDEAGMVAKMYVAAGEGRRVDVIVPQRTKSYVQRVVDVFLPAGYPGSDSLQAFSSSIAGMLSSRAVLQARTLQSNGYRTNARHIGVGVGDSSASPTAALLLSVLQESMGRIATILFAHRLGTALEPECKMYRLAADVLNDTAMMLDCLSPAFPKPLRVLVLSFSSVLRSLCGVCAGSAKASLSAHFAKKGNLGELNAPGNGHFIAWDVVVSWVSTPIMTWSVLIALLSMHLATNYAAVRAVSMRCLNRQRANIVFSTILQHGLVLTPLEVSQRERIFERDGVLRWVDDRILASCRIGAALEDLLSRLGQRHKRTGALELHTVKLSDLMDVFASEAYLLWFADSDCEAIVVLKQGCTPIDQLKAWTHALLLAQKLTGHLSGHKPKGDDALRADDRLAVLTSTLEDVSDIFVKYTTLLGQNGWDLDVAALETRAGMRIGIAALGPI